jgi:hypothetical protein
MHLLGLGDNDGKLVGLQTSRESADEVEVLEVVHLLRQLALEHLSVPRDAR